MVHPTDTSIAYPTMMTKWRFKCLTLTAHAERLIGRAHVTPHALIRHRCLRDAARIGKGGFGMGRQGEDAQHHVERGQEGRHAASGGEGGEGPRRITNQEPY